MRANQASFITKTLSKEVMKRSRLRNKLLNKKLILIEKYITNSFNSVVSLLRKEKLVEDDKILSQDAEIAKTFNEYFINIPILNMSNNQSFSTQTLTLEENIISGAIQTDRT